MEARSGKRSEEREDKLSLVRGADERGYGNEGLTATDPMPLWVIKDNCEAAEVRWAFQVKKEILYKK